MFLSRQLRLNLAQIHQGSPLFLSLLHKRFSRPSSSDAETEEDIAQARKWLSSFTLESVPRKSCEVTFSRASGPGNHTPLPSSSAVWDEKVQGWVNGLKLIGVKVDRMLTSTSQSYIRFFFLAQKEKRKKKKKWSFLKSIKKRKGIK